MPLDTRSITRSVGAGIFFGIPSPVWLLGFMLVAGIGATIEALFTHATDAGALAAAFTVHLFGWVLGASTFIRRRPLALRLCHLLWGASLMFGAFEVSPVIPFMRHDVGFFLGLGISSWAGLGSDQPAVRAWFGLQCPACDSQSVAARGVSMRRLACKACGRTWDSHAPGAVEPTPRD